MATSGLSDIGGKIKDVTAALAKADSELKWEMAGTAADVAGMVDPTPASDLIGAGLSLRKGDFLGAGLSVASMVPYLGDALAKPVKAVRATKSILAIEKKIAGLKKQLDALRAAEKQAEAAEAAAKQGKAATAAAESGAKAPAAKKAAEQQDAAAKGGKNGDCEDCGAAGGAKKGAAAAKKLPEAKIPCFHPFDKKKYKAMSKEKQTAYLKDMSKQLAGQEKGINGFTADEYLAARAAFKANNRNPLAKDAQADMRDTLEAQIRQNVLATLRKKGIRGAAADEQATEKAKAVLEKLAALHEPDMVAGGWLQPDPERMGRADVNSSIGGSWNQAGRVEAMDKAANDAVAAGNGDAKMNVKLETCRGKGLR